MSINLTDVTLTNVLIVIVIAIIVDALFGILKSIKRHEFDLRDLPKFVATGILPYIGGAGILALAAYVAGSPFEELFLVSAAAIVAKYLAEIKDKVAALFQVTIDK